MSKDLIIMLLGALTALLPFLGFPNAWDTVILVIIGVILISVGIVIRRGKKSPFVRRKNLRLFSEDKMAPSVHDEHVEEGR